MVTTGHLFLGKKTIMANTTVQCKCCGKKYRREKYPWYICDECNFRICPACVPVHKGKWGYGFKCSQCADGMLSLKL